MQKATRAEDRSLAAGAATSKPLSPSKAKSRGTGGRKTANIAPPKLTSLAEKRNMAKVKRKTTSVL